MNEKSIQSDEAQKKNACQKSSNGTPSTIAPVVIHKNVPEIYRLLYRLETLQHSKLYRLKPLQHSNLNKSEIKLNSLLQRT
jgi:hypothetical protein